jgi:ATP-dependent Lon protease
VQIYRKAAFRLVSEGIPQITVDAQSLTDFVGRPMFSHDRLYDMTPPGVVAGLAWTSLGENNLYFERYCQAVTSQLRMQVSSFKFYLLFSTREPRAIKDKRKKEK